MKESNIVILGAGFGGLACARQLKRVRAKITLVDKNNHHLFQPLLYQVATAGLSPADIAVPIRSVLRDQRNILVIMSEVVGISTGTNEVLLTSGKIPFDYLVVATGSRYHYFGHPEWAQHANSLKSITDATQIRAKILQAFERAEVEPDEKKRKALLTFVIIGGGPTGVELAGALAELAKKIMVKDFRRIRTSDAKIYLFEASKKILSSFDEHLVQRALGALKNLGVEICTESLIQEISPEGVRIGNEWVYSSTILWAAGVKASPVGEWLNVPTDSQGRVPVEKDLSVLDFPNIYVIGDAAGCNLPGIAPVAMQQGKYVADAIQNHILGKPLLLPFSYVNKGNLATVGRSFAIAEIGKLKISGFPAWVLWLVVHIYYLIGFRNRILVMIQWAWAYIRFLPGARLITGPR